MTRSGWYSRACGHELFQGRAPLDGYLMCVECRDEVVAARELDQKAIHVSRLELLPPGAPSAIRSAVASMMAFLRCPMVLKTLSWFVISFGLFLSCDLATHLVLHGTAGLADLARTAAVATLLACTVKVPPYFWHEHWWECRLTSRKDQA